MARSTNSGRSHCQYSADRAAARRRRAVGFLAAGMGAGLVGFPWSTLAHADSGATAAEPAAASASTYTDANTTAAEAFMYNPDSSILNNQGVNGTLTAYGEYAAMHSDAINTFTQLYSTEVAFYSELWGDFAQLGQLVEGGIQDGTSIANVVISGAKAASSFPPVHCLRQASTPAPPTCRPPTSTSTPTALLRST